MTNRDFAMPDLIDLYFRDVAGADTVLPLKLIVKICKSFRGRGIEFLDLIQEANLAVIERLPEFDATKGQFSTFCGKVARTALWKVVRERSTIIRVPEKTIPYVFSSITYIGEKQDDTDTDNIDITELETALAKLPTLERTIIKRFMAGWQHKEIAKDFGCSNHEIRNLEKKGLQILFDNIGAEYDGRTLFQMGVAKEKHKNKSTSVYVTAFGEKKTLSEWERSTGLSTTAIKHRLKKGWTPEKTMLTPGRRGKRRKP